MKQILSYFVRNPRGTDTLEGVARWRLLEEQVHRNLQETETALAWLVSRGFLQEAKTPGSGPVFRLDPEQRGGAVEFLAELGEGERK